MGEVSALVDAQASEADAAGSLNRLVDAMAAFESHIITLAAY